MSDLPKEVVEAKEQGKKVIQLSSDGYDFYFSKPTTRDIKRMLDKAGKNSGNFSTLMENHVNQSMLYPSQEEYDRIVEKKPGIFAALYNNILEITGMNESFLVTEL